MIIFIYGKDTYRSQEKLREIINSYKNSNKNGVNLKIINFKEKDFCCLKEELCSSSLFKEKKLLILKNTILNKKFKEDLLENQKILTNSKDIILFFEEGDVLQGDSLLKFVKKYGKIQEFKFLSGQKLEEWISQEFAKYDKDVEGEVLNKIILYLGTDTWLLANEIKKISSYKKEKKILQKDVDILLRPAIETNIFKTIDAIAQKNKKQALKLIYQHLEKGDAPLYLLSMISFQFRNLILIKNLIEKNIPYYSILKLSKLHPFVVKKSYSQCGEFSFKELKKIYQKIFQADSAIKKGRIDPETALVNLISYF
jgi:DNA polymerase-3 subunit delta